MKKNYFLIAVIAIALSTVATRAFAQDPFAPRIVPAPVECSLSASNYVTLKKVVVATNDEAAYNWVKDHFALWYKELAPTVTKVPYSGTSAHEEGYSISINKKEVRIEAANIKGARYAMQSLRQVTMPGRGTLKTENYIVPTGYVNDYPKTDFRGIHICWYPETQEWEIERMIRLAGYYKLNYVVLEAWGTYESKVAPWLFWNNPSMTKERIKKFVALSKDLGITLIPAYNIFSHASASSIESGKHATLDLHPEYAPLFEPISGWNWCLSNPESKKVIKSVIAEMLEDFDNPKYFHIGCNEALEPSCPVCKKQSYSKLFVSHVTDINKMLTKKGVRAMMWHDMLLKKGDERWADHTANGTEATAKAAEALPKNIIICDGYFGKSKKKEYKSYSYFTSLGYDLLACPWNNAVATTAQAKAARAVGAMGMLGTAWNKYTGSNLANSILAVSSVTWNPKVRTARYGYNFHTHFYKTRLREVGMDANLTEYHQFGTTYLQVPYATPIN